MEDGLINKKVVYDKINVVNVLVIKKSCYEYRKQEIFLIYYLKKRAGLIENNRKTVNIDREIVY